MKKKLFALLTISMMLLCLLPTVMANNNDSDVEDDDTGSDDTNESDDSGLRERDRLEKREALFDEHLEKRNAYYEKRLEKLDEMQKKRVEKLEEVHARKIAHMSEQHLERINMLSDAQLEKLAKLDRARLKEYSDLSDEELKERLDALQVLKVKREEAFRERVLAKEQLKAAEERYANAEKRYNQAKNEFKGEKLAWQRALESGNETAAIEHAKNYLDDAADMIIESLEKVRAKVAGSDDLTEEEAKLALAEIDARIERMEDLKEELAKADTKEEVKAVGKEIIAAWSLTRYRLQLHAETLVRGNIGEILSRSSALEAHLERVITEMEDANVSNSTIASLDDKVDDFSDLIASAREKYDDANALFEEAKETDDRVKFDESKELMRAAHSDLKEAHTILMSIVKEIKKSGFDFEDDDEFVEIIDDD
jgi:hypothetical protein